jgi:hypothetical protein
MIPTHTQRVYFDPAMKAAFWLAPMIIGLEILSSVLPGVGYFIGLPISLGAYFFQGALAVWYLRRDLNSPSLSWGRSMAEGLKTAFWSGVVLSSLVTGVSLLIEIPATAGAILVGLPAILASSALDLLFNLVFSAAGAWTYHSAGRKGILQGTFGLVILGIVVIVFLAFLFGVLLFGGAFGYLVHHILPLH